MLEFAVSESATIGHFGDQTIIFRAALYGSIINNLMFCVHIIAQVIAYRGDKLVNLRKGLIFEVMLQVFGVIAIIRAWTGSY